MKHVEKKCTLGWEKCHDCNYDTHNPLFMCDVCKGAEACLPTDCPGRPLTECEDYGIIHYGWDFINGEWKK